MSKTLTARELEALAAAEDLDIIDVRERREYLTGHVPRARLLPLETLRAGAKNALPRDNVVFVCAKGMRSQTAAELAQAIGLQQVYSLEGGTLAWATAGLPIVVPEEVKISDVERADAPAPAPSLEPELDAIVGANLRELRAARELSLDTLARTAGISRQLLGQIELGRAVPSIGVVWKLAQALGVPFSRLLVTTVHVGTRVMRRAAGKRLMSADGRFASRALFGFGSPRRVEIYELWLAAHSRDDADAHQAGTRENLIVADGRLELKVGGETFVLDKGDAIDFAADVPHAYVNPGNEECVMHLVMTYTDVIS